MPSEMEIEAGRNEIARRLQEMHKLHLATSRALGPAGDTQQLNSMAVSILGLDQSSSQQPVQHTARSASVADMATARITRKAQSYFNNFQTSCTPAHDDPPSYATAARQKPVARRDVDIGKEALPGYSCSVSASVRMLVNMESVSPMHGIAQSEWRDVFVEVRGTMLNFNRVKDNKPGRLLRSYTLQHAEIGLAPDAFHTVLTPNSKLAHLIPNAAKNKAYKKDPQLFRAEEQFIMRLRLETDQLLLAHKSEDTILEMVHDIGAGIDLAPALDERSISKQCTVPRRRRRPNPPPQNDITDASVIAEQERILQRMYPSFAEHAGAAESNTTTSEPAESTTQPPTTTTPAREEEELDLTAIREDFSETNVLTPTSSHTSTTATTTRPSYSRTTTASTVATSNTIYETAPTNFGPEGKWQPPHLRTAAQIRRYVRRCAPLLTSDAVRASDIVICNGRRMRINWPAERLEDWRLQPPSYSAHAFDKEQQKQSRPSLQLQEQSLPSPTSETTAELHHEHPSSPSSATSSSSPPSSVFSETSTSPSSISYSHDDHEDAITPTTTEEQRANNGLANLELVKTSSVGSMEAKKEMRKLKHASTDTNAIDTPSTNPPAANRLQKAREVRRENSEAVDVQGVVFCF